ncbi:ribosomal protein S18 acetylase RimI-like enzyme [Anaerosolibacter carboniphilus]|uniref:Ribosomal protein S18 acetylase RimI-like enzyme n=1 Tax=Anaerosolibacter carboniphilus TaxID=1417629 RepID=A0A841L3Q1_9FIRM|nr:GNAT family N-acetyltransferase [Anaerosolibacter carboniphilus]MBB6217762.1 ribosomal protein S18 acetylase RimI-like enzyme [Anaerosolibacter carboniphilus]
MIRKINKKDIDRVLEFLKRELETVNEDRIKEELKNIDNNRLIYESNSEIYGFTVAISNKELKRGKVILYVSETKRRNGIGEQLYLAALGYLERQDINYITTEIRTEKNHTGDFFIHRGFNKRYGYHSMMYTGGKVNSDLQLINYDDNYYEAYKKVYEDCFFEMRKELGFKPYRDCSSADKLIANKDKIFLLLDSQELIGSVLLLDNEIDDLIVNEEYQGQGYGKKLINFGINYCQSRGDKNISLGVIDWNAKAIALYVNSGFNIISKGEVYHRITK